MTVTAAGAATRIFLIPPLLALALSLHTASGFAGETASDPYLASLEKEAVDKKLADERFWHLLVHYKPRLFGGYESQEDGPDFFNSPNGKTDPQAELTATLAAFFTPPEDLKPGQEHPQCNFPARYKWLKLRLSFDPARLPERRCERLEGWLAGLDPEKATIVFASHYLNNPASMFGHTFLRIDKKRTGPEQKLLDYGINYSAIAETNHTLVYIYKGLFGGFKGVFSIFPYYVKVQEYNNLENRDLWEYELNLTDDQLNYLLLHVWELGGNYFDYFYFQENCSYHILSLLEVADPDLHLTDQFTFQVIPADTIKILTRYDGLISREVYRPSLLSQLNDKRSRMTRAETRVFYRLVKDPSLVENDDYRRLAAPEKALVLDAYLDYAQYRTMQKERTASMIAPNTRQFLLERSRLDVRADEHRETARFSTPPVLGHGSVRLGLDFGRNGKELFEQISLRPGYHDLLAKDDGFSRNSQILFFDVTGRYYNDSEEARLDNLKLIDIVSLTPYDPLLFKKSWKLGFGVDTVRDLSCDYCNSLYGRYAMGLSFQPGFSSPILFYGFAGTKFEVFGRIQPHYRLGGEGTAGVLLDVTRNWKVQASGEYLSFPFGRVSRYYKASAVARYAISRNVDVRGGWTIENSRREWFAGINFYY